MHMNAPVPHGVRLMRLLRLIFLLIALRARTHVADIRKFGRISRISRIGSFPLGGRVRGRGAPAYHSVICDG